MNLYVNAKAKATGDGTKENPFRTIQAAADIAAPGDTVMVAPGIYRERVNPKCGGTAEARITYVSIEPLKAVITGAEELREWHQVEGKPGVWTAKVNNDIFGDYNPYTTLVWGDWYIQTMIAHTGDVYLNGKSMYEVTSEELVYQPQKQMGSWEPGFTLYCWYAKQDGNDTVFLCNFGDKNPNEEQISISVRKNCFFPEAEGLGYITLRGFTVCCAATQWAPPTAFQDGMIGPHWSKGWIIEDCDIFESKCSGISLGKYYQKGNDNKWSHWKYKDGTQTQRECVCIAQAEGWSKETIGSHIVRRCTIHDCGQTGIVGHLGGVFSMIEDNHIYRINNKRNLAGAEIGGIKMHAAIDCVYRRNHIHHCTRGIWLDWQAQGTRVTQNFFHDNDIPTIGMNDTNVPQELLDGNGEDLFIEVSHGPTLVDNNLFLSDRTIKLACQGVACVHNLFAGGISDIGLGTDNGTKSIGSVRYTPYHLPHRTEIANFMSFLHGDDKFYNNVFVQLPMRKALKELMDRQKADNAKPHACLPWDDGNLEAGLHGFDDGYPTFEEWQKEFEGYCGMGSAPSDRYYIHLPIWASGNVYLNGARPWKKETGSIVDNSADVYIKVEQTADGYRLDTNLIEVLSSLSNPATLLTTDSLGIAFEPEQKYESADGTPITFDEDYYGHKRSHQPLPGPFEA